MSRGNKTIKKRDIVPDPIYGSVLVSRFINRTMMSGKKTTAQRMIYGAFDIIKEQGKDPVETLEKAIDSVAPKQEVRAKRVGGAAYQVPMEVRGPRKVSLAIRWILEAAKKRPTSEYKTFDKKLAAELLAVLNNEGEAVRKRDTIHKMAEANKAFSHFRF
jgi:small subunit ribosomal protein S7